MANNRLVNLQFNIDYLQKLMFHLESWLSHANQNYNIPGYAQLVINRSVRRRGGVAASTKNSCSHNIIG